MIPEEGLKENNGIAGSILLSLPVLKQALNSLLQQKSSDIAEPTVIFLCGEGGIRTLGTSLSSYNGLANRPFRPLRHLSGWAAKIKINACKSQKTNPKFGALSRIWDSKFVAYIVTSQLTAPFVVIQAHFL